MTGSGGSSGSSLAEEVDGAQRDAACLLSSAQPMAPLPCYLLLPNSSPASSLPPPPMPLSCRTSAILLPPGHQQPEEFELNFDHLAENSQAGVHHRSLASSLACCLPHIWAVDYIPLHHYHPTQYPPTIFSKQSTSSDLMIPLLPYCHILDHIVWGCFILSHFAFTFTWK